MLNVSIHYMFISQIIKIINSSRSILYVLIQNYKIFARGTFSPSNHHDFNLFQNIKTASEK